MRLRLIAALADANIPAGMTALAQVVAECIVMNVKDHGHDLALAFFAAHVKGMIPNLIALSAAPPANDVGKPTNF